MINGKNFYLPPDVTKAAEEAFWLVYPLCGIQDALTAALEATASRMWPPFGPDGRRVDRPVIERDKDKGTGGDPDWDVFYDAAGNGWHLAPEAPDAA